MSAPFIGEIRMMPYSFAPRGWAYCHGQLTSIAQNPALFSIIGVAYGGDGRTTMGLPDLIGRTPIGAGQGPGLSNHIIGRKGGEPMVALTTSEIPNHTHETNAYLALATTDTPSTAVSPSIDNGPDNFYIPSSKAPPTTNMSSAALATAGLSQHHENRQPFLGMSFFINLDGMYPSRN